jgi:integral membrane protein (TIGR01906 family)
VTVGIGSRIASAILALAFAIVVVAASVVAFLNPVWVGFEQGRSQAAAWTGYTDAQLRTATDAILSDLVFGPPTFDVQVDGQAVLNERERSHMADVRTVFTEFALVAVVSLVVVIAGWVVLRHSSPRTFWRSIRWGSAVLAVVVVVVGAIGLFAFDAVFEVFHRLFFAGGTYTFDPRTDRLVQLFPDAFWLETSLAVGAVILAICVMAWLLAGRRLTSRTAFVPATVRPAEASR